MVYFDWQIQKNSMSLKWNYVVKVSWYNNDDAYNQDRGKTLKWNSYKEEVSGKFHNDCSTTKTSLKLWNSKRLSNKKFKKN